MPSFRPTLAAKRAVLAALKTWPRRCAHHWALRGAPGNSFKAAVMGKAPLRDT